MKTVVIGAGPVGALAALYAAQRGHYVEVYELRSDLRDPSTVPLNFTKSINLALSERGINAIKNSKRPGLLDSVMAETITVRGRMIHGKKSNGELYEDPQDYDVNGRTIYAVDRAGLNKRLLDELEEMPNVTFFFNHKLTGADYKTNKAWFEQTNLDAGRPDEVEVSYDFLIGADGAHSSARYHLMKYTRMDYQQTYVDTLWCEFQISAKEIYPQDDPDAQFKISPHHLHIWPGKEFMFIAIPSLDGSFTCTLFMPARHYETLEASPKEVPSFFDKYFPGVTTLIPSETLIKSFTTNPHLPLISIKCAPHHFGSSAVIIGDAAHAMVPFFGQGMNAGLEDVRVLFSTLDKYTVPTDVATSTVNPEPSKQQRAAALAEYSFTRTPDAAAINDLALQNYVEMRASVISPVYRLRKFLEESLSVWVPSLGWKTKYSRVSFGNEKYSEVVTKTERQGQLLLRGLVSILLSPVVIGAVLALYRWKKTTRAPVGLLKLQNWFGWKTT